MLKQRANIFVHDWVMNDNKQTNKRSRALGEKKSGTGTSNLAVRICVRHSETRRRKCRAGMQTHLTLSRAWWLRIGGPGGGHTFQCLNYDLGLRMTDREMERPRRC